MSFEKKVRENRDLGAAAVPCGRLELQVRAGAVGGDRVFVVLEMAGGLPRVYSSGSATA